MKRTALGEGAGALFGPLLTLRAGSLNDCVACEGLARRGRRHPAGAHAGTVYASLRLRCAARPGVAPRTRCAHFVRYAQTGGAKSVLEARCARSTSRLRGSKSQKSPPAGPRAQRLPRGNGDGLRRKAYAGAYVVLRAQRATDGQAPRRIRSLVVRVEGNQRLQRGRRHPVGSGGGDFWGDEQRRLGVGARSAHPKLTRRACLSVANEVSAASSRRDAEPSSTVESARSADRPSMSPRQAPPGDACRAALTYTRIADAQPAAMGRTRAITNARPGQASRVAHSTVELSK